MTKPELDHLLNLIMDARKSQTDCRHEHHCHNIPALFEAEEIVSTMRHELDVQEGEQLLRPTPS